MNPIISALLWRVRGGLRFFGHKLPMNKIWFAVYFAYATCYDLNSFIVNFIACYTSYQLFGLGLYVGRLLTGLPIDPEKDEECELIDDILFSLHKGDKWLYQYPRVFGFIGTCLTGLIITFICGLPLQNLGFILSGLAMGPCYWLGGKIEPYFPLGKNGWNWGEWIFGFYLGLVL